MEITDKNVIITGGVKGIGNTILHILLQEGANIGVFDIDDIELEKLFNKNPEIFIKRCDVSDKKQVKVSIDEYYSKFNRIDILINNAAMVYNSPIINFSQEGFKLHDMELWDKIIATDLSSVFYMSAFVVEKMILKRTKGVIINISSICSAGNAGQSAYSAAKSGINALTVTMAKELSLLGIRVAGIAPGFVGTETTLNSMTENVLNDWKKRIPLRRLGKPEEVADAVIFIIKNDYFNGRILRLDGGLRI